MINARELAEAVNSVAPFYNSAEWDNSGLLLDCGAHFSRVLFALDATKDVLIEAAERQCGALVTHHPVIFGALKRMSVDDPVTLAAKCSISIVSAHTCFDSTDGGVNDVLCGLLGLSSVTSFGDIGRAGSLPSMPEDDFIAMCKKALGCDYLPAVLQGKPINRVAVVGGSGGEYVGLAASLGCDALVTGEIKHHEALIAKQRGVCAVAAGHFATENPSISALCEGVSKQLGDRAECMVSQSGRDPFSYV